MFPASLLASPEPRAAETVLLAGAPSASQLGMGGGGRGEGVREGGSEGGGGGGGRE